MAGENVKQYFLKDHVTGDYFCSFCYQKYAKGTTSTRLRGHLTGEAKTGARRCPIVSQLVRDSLATESSKTQKALPDNFPSTSFAQLPNSFGNQRGVQSAFQRPMRDEEMVEVIQDYVPVQNYDTNFEPGQTSGNIVVEDYVIAEYLPPCLEDQTNEDTAEAAAYIETYMETCSLSNDGWISDHYQKSLEDQTNEDTMVENVSNLQQGEIARSMGGATPANQTGSKRVSPTADVLTDEAEQNGVQSCEGRVHVEVPSAEGSSVQRTRREGIVQSSNKRQRRTPDALPIVAALEVPMVEGIQDTGESASLTKCPVGDAFGRNVEKIWSWLMDNQVLRVGICGMGGVGKTTLMRHIQTRLKGQSSLKVFWVTVSQDFSIWKLQDLIAKQIDLEFLDKEDEVERAEKLTQTLKAKGRCVLILDDFWNDVELDKVGIPVGVNACKLVLTTRLLEVCRKMDCSERNTIQLQLLSEDEAWILFTQELGNYRTEVEELAKAVSRECAGLPLGIRVMARSMKGIYNVHTWRNTLEELKESKVSEDQEMREEVLSLLKFSYLRLIDPALQECLSYCALFPEDDKILRNELIEYMIVEGIIDEKKSRQAELDKGHTMLDTLENACLLEGDTENVWMHDLIRDMLILELREGSKTLVEAGAQLEELPDVEKWTENLVRVSLISNDIEVIPSGHTPRCPNLSTLLLCKNLRLKMIADSFFEQFQGLKILDLSWCNKIKKLPGSISNLVNLTALLLHGCGSLIHVPSLAKQEKLKKLDLSDCERLKQMPEGVRFLLNLKYLDLSRTGIEEIGSGILPMLSRLQVLKLRPQYANSKFSIRGSEVGELRMLETLHCRFINVREFGEYMKSRERSQQSPTDYSIFIAGHSIWPTERKLGSRKIVKVKGYNFIDPLALPTDIEALHIDSCYSSLCKGLFPPSLLASLLNLQEVRVDYWDAIEEIFAMNEGGNGEWGFPFSNYSTHSLPNHSLLNLKLINICGCRKLKKLFPPCLLPNLHNLQMISVDFCKGMEEIFSTDQEEEDGQELLFDQPNLTGLHLSRLTTLKLRSLPELRSIYKGAIVCHSLQQIELVRCPKLKRITLPLPQPSLQRIQVYPKEWWESLQWVVSNGKKHLESLCVFKHD